jgi:DNA-directed RNA polymerase specialized sigma24 family protein
LSRSLDVFPWPPSSHLDQAYERMMRRDSLDHQQEIARMTAAELLDSAVRLGSLSVESKRLLSSIYIDGISGKEAASRHQITASSVRVRCSRAVKELQRHLPQLLAAA